MQSNIRKLLAGLSKCALLLLSILVVGWGLGAKLDLYHVDQHQLPTISSTAKLCLETRSGPAIVSVQQRARVRVTSDSVHFVSVQFPLPEAGLSVSAMRRLESSCGSTRRRALCGPSWLRRPPPVLL